MRAMSSDRRDDIDEEAEARMVRIMLYRDGRLSPQEAAEVANEIATDPEAARITIGAVIWPLLM